MECLGFRGLGILGFRDQIYDLRFRVQGLRLRV